MSETPGFRYRAELPRVVEAVHHRNALAALAERKIKLAEDATWQEICERSDWVEGEHRLTHITYMGRVAVGRIFGKEGWRLNYSKPTPQGGILSHEAGDLELLHKHTRIHLSHSTGFAEVMLIPDSPPITMDEKAIEHVMWYAENPVPVTNDSRIIEAVQRLTSNDGKTVWEYVDEETAASLIYALENDQSFSQYA